MVKNFDVRKYGGAPRHHTDFWVGGEARVPSPPPDIKLFGLVKEGGGGHRKNFWTGGGICCTFGINMLWGYIIGMFALMLVWVFTRGFWNSELVHFVFSFKSFSHPYFRLGLSFHKEVYLDREVEILSFGLFFLTLDIEFVQPLSEDEKKVQDMIQEALKKAQEENDATAPSDDSSVQP